MAFPTLARSEKYLAVFPPFSECLDERFLDAMVADAETEKRIG
jgi:hypothetical protein